jgi:hypothetical protein
MVVDGSVTMPTAMTEHGGIPTMQLVRALTGAALAGALVLAVAAPAAASTPETTLRAFHDSPDTGKVEILVNGAPAGIQLTYPNATPYIKLPVGAKVTVRIIEGTGTGAALDITVPASTRPLTVAAIGSLTALVDGNPANDGQALRLKAYADRAGLWGNWALLRVNHTSPDAPAVDVQVRLGGYWVTVIRSLDFAESSAYLPLPQKNPFTGKLINYTFRVKVSGTSTVVTQVTTPLPNKAQSVWAIGFASKLGTASPDAFGLKITKDGAN